MDGIAFFWMAMLGPGSLIAFLAAVHSPAGHAVAKDHPNAYDRPDAGAMTR